MWRLFSSVVRRNSRQTFPYEKPTSYILTSIPERKNKNRNVKRYRTRKRQPSLICSKHCVLLAGLETNFRCSSRVLHFVARLNGILLQSLYRRGRSYQSSWAGNFLVFLPALVTPAKIQIGIPLIFTAITAKWSLLNRVLPPITS